MKINVTIEIRETDATTAIDIIRELAKAGAINSTEATTQPHAEPAEIEPDRSSKLVKCPRCQGSGRRTTGLGLSVPCGLCDGRMRVTRKDAEDHGEMLG